MSSAILTVKNIVKRFSGTVALKGVDMELYSNEILALVGENGAGKPMSCFPGWTWTR